MSRGAGNQVGLFLGSIGTGLIGAIAGTAALWLLLRALGLDEELVLYAPFPGKPTRIRCSDGDVEVISIRDVFVAPVTPINPPEA